MGCVWSGFDSRQSDTGHPQSMLLCYNKNIMNKILKIGFLIVCIFLIAAYLSHTDRDKEGEAGEPIAKEPASDSDVAEDEEDKRDYDNYIEIDLGDFHQYWRESFNTYHSLLGKKLEEYEEVKFSGYVTEADKDRYSMYTVADSQSPDTNANAIKVGCWVGDDEHPEKGYAIGDYITVQGRVDYGFTRGELIIRCSVIEKEGKITVRAYDYDSSKPYSDTTVSAIQNDFSANIASLETALPRDRLIQSSGYYVEGPGADFGTSIGLSKDRVEDWDQPIQPGKGYRCLSTDYSLIEDIQDGDYVTWWVYFGSNWHHENNCTLAKIQKTAPPN